MKHLLITGASGFIGQHLSKSLKKNYRLSTIIRPTTDTKFLNQHHINYFVFKNNILKLDNFIKANHFAGVIHLATLFINQHQPKDILPLIKANIYFPGLILDLAAKNQIPWFINTGTYWQHQSNQTYSPVNLYAATKQSFEDLAQSYWQNQKIVFTTLSIGNTFGPHDHRQKIFDLWHQAAISQKPISMASAKSIIDMVYIDDVCRAYQQMILNLNKNPIKHSGKTYRISHSQTYNLKQLAQIFSQITQLKLNINWSEGKNKNTMLSPWTNASIVPNWSAQVSIEEGIKKTYQKTK